MKTSFICWVCFFPLYLAAQLGVGTTAPNSSSILDVASTSKGFLMPQLTTTQMNAISSPAQGLMVFNTTIQTIRTFNGRDWVTDKKHKGGFADGGTYIELGNIRIRMSSTNFTVANSI